MENTEQYAVGFGLPEHRASAAYVPALVIPLYGDEAGHEVDMTYFFRLNNQPPPHQANRARPRNPPHNQIKDPRQGSQGSYAHRAGHGRLS